MNETDGSTARDFDPDTVPDLGGDWLGVSRSLDAEAGEL